MTIGLKIEQQQNILGTNFLYVLTMKRRAITVANVISGPHQFNHLYELVLFHNRGFPIGGDKYTSYHSGQEKYVILLPDLHGILVPFGKAPRRIVDGLRDFLLNANMEVDDENLVIYSKRSYNCFGQLFDEDITDLTNDIKHQVSGNPYLKDLEYLTQEMHPLGAHPRLTVPVFLNHNLGLLNVSAHLIIYNTANDGDLNEVWLPQTATYDLEGRQATFIATPPDLNTADPLHTLFKKSEEEGTNLPYSREFIELEGMVRHLALRADGTFNPKESAVFSLCVPTDFTLASNKPGLKFERFTVDELIEKLLSRHFTPDASMALTYFLCKEGVVVGQQRENIETVCNKSLYEYYNEGIGDYGAKNHVAERTSIHRLSWPSASESIADMMSIDRIIN